MKAALAAEGSVHIDRYGEDKKTWIHAGLERAEAWAEATRWMP